MLTYRDLLRAKPDDFAASARALAPTLAALAGAASTLTDVVKPIGAGKAWHGDAAAHAHITGQVHQHALTIATEELTAAARALQRFAIDINDLQTAMGRFVSDAQAAGVVVRDDGSTSFQTTTVIAGDTTKLDPVTLGRLQAAEATFHRRRDGLLQAAHEIDGGCASMLQTIGHAASKVVIASDNTVPHAPWRGQPPGVQRLELELNLPVRDGDGSIETVEKVYSNLLTLLDASNAGNEKIQRSVANAMQMLEDSKDPDVRATATRFRDLWSKFELPRTARLTTAMAPVLEFLLNVAKYSRSTDSVVTVAEKAGISTATSAGLGLLFSRLGSGVVCAILDAPDDEATFSACEGLATLLGVGAGGKTGELAGDWLNDVIYGDDGVPDPFINEYEQKAAGH